MVQLHHVIFLHIVIFVTLTKYSCGFVEEETEGIQLPTRAEKTTHLHFYFHDIVSTRNATAIRIAGPANSTAGAFGSMMMADDPLTEGPELTSKLVGKAQGMYAMAAQNDVALLMVMNLAFLEGSGKYNGSSISILGRNTVFDDVREMPIVGGTGAFRFARGYALAHTVWFNMKGDVTVEYNVYVSHN